MRDCPNAEIRDQLCDVVHRTLPEAECRRIEEHIATCADCTAEIALLRRAHALLHRTSPTVDTAAIVGALPRPRQARPTSFVNWRIAASIAVIALGASSLSLLRVQRTGDGRTADSIGTAAVASADAQSLSFSGRLSALAEEDLEQLLTDIDAFDGTTPVEPGTVLPVPGWEGGAP